jgi:hypothetical protein
MDPAARYLMDVYTIPRFRQRYFLPPHRACPIMPVVFVLLLHEHFFTVVMDHGRSRVYVLGRSIQADVDNDEWEEWRGPTLYNHICDLHGWQRPEDMTTIQIVAVNWQGNGYDCGPISIRVILDVFENGLGHEYLASVGRVIEDCGHMTRIQIYQDLKAMCRTAAQDFTLFSENPPEEWNSWNVAREQPTDYEISEDDLHRATRIGRVGVDIVVQGLLQAITACRECNRFGKSSSGSSENRRDDLEGHRQRTPGRPDPAQSPPCDDDDDPSEPRLGKSSRLRKGRQQNLDWTQLQAHRFFRPNPRCDVPLPEGPLYLRHDPHFDDYNMGPTREDLRMYEDPICPFPSNPYAQLVKKTFWVTFRDYGYRLLSRFPHMTYLQCPTHVEHHVLQDGLPEDYSPANHFPNLINTDIHLSRSAYPDLRSASYNDVVLMGAQEMLDYVGHEFSWAGHDLFVRGRQADGRYVCLDLERDVVESVSLEPSIDVDSLIWVTSQLKTKLKIQLMMTPTIRKTAPIHKSNHIYFELLIPPTDDERAYPQSREWPEISMPLSACPHTTFAKVSDGVNVYIFFPRMIHRDEHSGHRITLMPLQLQELFWDKVLLPALREHLDAASMPYMGFTVQDFQRKTASKARPKGSDHYSGTAKAISPSVLEKTIKSMRRILREEPGFVHDRFGSFFFVLEAKGIKLYTQESLGSWGDPWQTLCDQFPQLDFDYMMDQTKGQLVADIGISINPSIFGDPVVGLWRLDALDASFGAGGFTKGQVHNVNTLGRYGAIQATMASERMRRTHIIYRSTYTLQYETTRRKDNKPFFADDGDAYQMNERFHAACEAREEIYSGKARESSYGVRDEYRVSGQAIKILIQQAKPLVCDYNCTTVLY